MAVPRVSETGRRTPCCSPNQLMPCYPGSRRTARWQEPASRTDARLSWTCRRWRGESDAWHDQVRAIVGANGGESALADYHDGLLALRALRPGAVVVNSVEGRIDDTYRAMLAALDATTT